MGRSLSGWQRIGVVLSVLLIAGFPTYFYIQHNNRVGDRLQRCLDLQTKYFPELSFHQIWDKCNQVAHFMSLSYFVNGSDVGLFWAFRTDTSRPVLDFGRCDLLDGALDTAWVCKVWKTMMRTIPTKLVQLNGRLDNC